MGGPRGRHTVGADSGRPSAVWGAEVSDEDLFKQQNQGTFTIFLYRADSLGQCIEQDSKFALFCNHSIVPVSTLEYGKIGRVYPPRGPKITSEGLFLTF